MGMTVLVTGGAGFIGSNFVFHMLRKYPDYKVICVDCLTYAGNLSTLQSVMAHPNFVFYRTNICDRAKIYQIFEVEISRRKAMLTVLLKTRRFSCKRISLEPK